MLAFSQQLTSSFLAHLPPPSAPGFSCDFQEESEGPGGALELLLFLKEWQTGWWRAPRGLRPPLHGHGHLVVFIMAILLIEGDFGIISVQTLEFQVAEDQWQ